MQPDEIDYDLYNKIHSKELEIAHFLMEKYPADNWPREDVSIFLNALLSVYVNIVISTYGEEILIKTLECVIESTKKTPSPNDFN